MTTAGRDILEFNEEKPEVPKTLNVLTILSIIGSAISMIGIVAIMWFGGMVIRIAGDADAMEKMAPDKRARLLKSKEFFQLYHDNMTPLLIVVFAGALLCIIGAIKMRQLKKDGFYIYVFGEVAPIIATAVIIGFSVQYTSPMSYAIGMVIPLVFIILYSQQLKFMNNGQSK